MSYQKYILLSLSSFLICMSINHNHLLRYYKVQSEYIIEMIKINYFNPFLKMEHNFSTDESICSQTNISPKLEMLCLVDVKCYA